jgi:hypothetical protein
LPSQFVGRHRRRGLHTRHDCDPDTQTLNRFDESTEIAVTRKKENVIYSRGDLERVNGEVHAYAAPRPLTFILIMLYRLRSDGEPIGVKPISEMPNAAASPSLIAE